ncbi:MAG: hypothetical protein ACFE0I_07390 [Elainellaceae cyanobacterium]
MKTPTRNSSLNGFLKQSKYFIIGALATLTPLAIHSKANAASPAALGGFISPITIIFLIVGITVCVFYIKAMLTVLNEAADSYTEVEDDTDGSYYASPAWGAALAGIIAAIVIWSYGVNPSFFYLGPVLSMLSPVAILYCMMQDIKNFKLAHMDTKSKEKQAVSELIEH